MSEWGDKIKEVIDSIPFASYSRSSGDGVTEDIFWGEKRIYKAANPPTSYCVGAVMEAFIKTLKKFKNEDEIDVSMLSELRRWTFVYEEKYRDGIAGGLVSLGWGDWVEDPYKAEYGDLAQIQGVSFDQRGANGIPYWDDGHCVIVEGVGQKDGIDCIFDWSATTSGPNGHAHDWHAINKSRNGINRRWKIARMKPSFLGQAMFDSTSFFSLGMIALGLIGSSATAWYLYSSMKGK